MIASRVPTSGRLLIEWFVLLVGATLLVGGLILTGATARLDYAIYDVAMSFRHRPAPPEIVIVGIDHKSTDRQGVWPWPRLIQAQLLSNIARDHPRSVAYDVLFQARGDARGDDAFRKAMSTATVFLPMALEEQGQGYGANLTEPIPQLASAAAGLGRSNPTTDVDGIVRRTYLFSRYDDQLLPQLMVLVANHDRPGAVVPPRGSDSQMLIPYAGPPGRYSHVSAAQVADGHFPPGLFKDKYVLVGATALGLLDNYPTPSSGSAGMPNVEIDANILDAILHHRLIRALPQFASLALSIAAVWLIFAGILFFRPGHLIAQGAVAALLIFGGSVASLALGGLWISPASAMITGTLLQVIWSSRRLQAASDYFARELAELQIQGAGALPPPRSGLRVADSVSRQMVLIDETKRRVRGLRRYVNDVLANFPEPVMVVSHEGRIIMFNPAATILGNELGHSTEPGAPIQPLLEDLENAAGEGRKLWPPSPAGEEAPRGVAPGGRILEARYTSTGYDPELPAGWTVQLVDVTAIVSAMRQREDAMKLFTHDMRAPQSAILAVLEHKDFRGVPEILRENIERNALRTLNLADGFVRLAQAEAAEYVFQPIDLFHPVGDAADALWSIAQAASVEIVVKNPLREFVISADRSLLSRALINLIDNAIKASQPGASVVCAFSPVDLHGRPAVALTIADQAAGMTEEQLKTLFKRFARTATKAAPGTTVRLNSIGLGLAMVYTVVTRHNGQIDCRSEVGEGTTFTITLPLFDEIAVEGGVMISHADDLA